MRNAVPDRTPFCLRVFKESISIGILPFCCVFQVLLDGPSAHISSEGEHLTGHGLNAGVYVTLKNRKRPLSGINDHNVLWHYRSSYNAELLVVAVFKEPQLVVA